MPHEVDDGVGVLLGEAPQIGGVIVDVSGRLGI